MMGTWLNVGAIVLGGILGLSTKANLSAARQQLLRVLLGVATVWFGLKLCWKGLATHGVKFFFFQLIIVFVALVVGHLLGRFCGVQKLFNAIGQVAKEKMESATTSPNRARNDGFLAVTLLFCAAPLGIIGALEDGLARGYVAPLAIKAVMDGLAAFSFVRMFSWTTILSAVPVAALLSSLTVLGWRLEPWLTTHGVIGTVHATSGLIMTSIAVVIFEVRKVDIANYLPALIVAPALMKLAELVF